jgi:hypothetical protein
LQKAWAICDRFGKVRNTVAPADKKRPNRGFKKIECPMHAFITENIRDSGIWNFTVQCSDHNHLPTTKLGAHAAIRKLYKGKKFKERIAAYETADMLARHTYITDKIKNSDNPFIARDYYNQRAKIRRNKFNGKSPIYALLEALDAFNEIEEAFY